MRTVLAVLCVALLASCASRVSPVAATTVERAHEALRACRYDDATQLIEAGLPTATPVDRALLQTAAGVIRERRGDLPGAISLYRQAMESESFPLQAPLLLGIAEVRSREFAAGHGHLHAYIGAMVKRRQYPTWSAIAVDAVALGELGRADDAHRLLTDSIEMPEYSMQLLFDLRALAGKVVAGAPAPPGTFWRVAFGSEAAATGLDTDFGPTPLKRVKPRYPERASRARIEGAVLLGLTVSAQGEPVDFEVLESTPPGVFDDAALRAVEQWTFRPASRNCAPVATRAVQKISFRMGRG